MQTAIQSGDAVYLRGDIYTGEASVHAVENNGTEDVVIRVVTPEGRKLRYDLRDLVSGKVLRGGAPQTDGQASNGHAYGHPLVNSPLAFSAEEEVALEYGNIVRVNGTTFTGTGMVLAVWEEPTGTDATMGIRDRDDQSYPQVEVRTSDGRDIHFNGDDLAAGKIACIRQSHGGDFETYGRGKTKAVATPDGLMVPYSPS